MMGPAIRAIWVRNCSFLFRPEMVAFELEVEQRQHFSSAVWYRSQALARQAFENDSVQQEQSLVLRGVARQFRQYGVNVRSRPVLIS